MRDFKTPILKNICERLFLYFRILKKFFFEKWTNGKSKARKNWKSQEFLISEFSILPYSQNRNVGFKNLGRNFRDFRGFRVFDLTILSASFEGRLNFEIFFFWFSCSPWNLEWVFLLYLFHLIHSSLLEYCSVLPVYGLPVSWLQSILLCFRPMFSWQIW